MPTLDVEQKELLVHYADDSDYQWHHRLLLIPLGGASWIWATPDLEIERADVDQFRVVVLARASAFPSRYVNDIYAFDPMSPSILNKLLSEARSLAAVLGAPLPANAAVPSHVIWRISDTSHPDFGEEIPAGALGNTDIFVPRGPRGKMPVSLWSVSTASGQQRHERSLESPVGSRLSVGFTRAQVGISAS